MSNEQENIALLADGLARAMSLTPEEKKRASEAEGNVVADQLLLLTAATETLGLPSREEQETFTFATEIYNACARYCRAYAVAIEKLDKEEG